MRLVLLPELMRVVLLFRRAGRRPLCLSCCSRGWGRMLRNGLRCHAEPQQRRDRNCDRDPGSHRFLHRRPAFSLSRSPFGSLIDVNSLWHSALSWTAVSQASTARFSGDLAWHPRIRPRQKTASKSAAASRRPRLVCHLRGLFMPTPVSVGDQLHHSHDAHHPHHAHHTHRAGERIGGLLLFFAESGVERVGRRSQPAQVFEASLLPTRANPRRSCNSPIWLHHILLSAVGQASGQEV